MALRFALRGAKIKTRYVHVFGAETYFQPVKVRQNSGMEALVGLTLGGRERPQAWPGARNIQRLSISQELHKKSAAYNEKQIYMWNYIDFQSNISTFSRFCGSTWLPLKHIK